MKDQFQAKIFGYLAAFRYYFCHLLPLIPFQPLLPSAEHARNSVTLFRLCVGKDKESAPNAARSPPL